MAYQTNRVRIVTHLIATNFYGGPEKQIIEHLLRLNNREFQGEIVSFIEKTGGNELLDKAVQSKLIGHGIEMFNLLDIKAQCALIKILKKQKVDLLCTHGYKACVMGWWAAKRINIPIIAFSRGYTTENKKVAFYEWLERKILKKVNGIVFVSEGQRNRLETSFGVRGQRSWVVHNAVSVTHFEDRADVTPRGIICERLNIPEDCQLIVTAGRLSPEKGHRFLVEAIGKMKGAGQEKVFFVFCGDGPCKRDLEKQAMELGVHQNCRFPGFRKDLGEIFKAMDLFVLPSLTEGLPNVILEAFACAKPVVATNVGGVPEIVEDKINGFLVPPQHPDLLSKVMVELISDQEQRSSFGMAGYSKVKQTFTFESQTKKLEAIYHEVEGCAW